MLITTKFSSNLMKLSVQLDETWLKLDETRRNFLFNLMKLGHQLNENVFRDDETWVRDDVYVDESVLRVLESGHEVLIRPPFSYSEC